METVKVKALQTHAGKHGIIPAGESYETDTLHAQELVNKGLVSAPGIKAAAATGKGDGYVADLLVKDEPKEKKEVKETKTTKEKKQIKKP